MKNSAACVGGRTDRVEERFDEVWKICRSNRTELETKIARGVVKVKSNVLTTTTKLVQITVDGVYERIDNEISENIVPTSQSIAKLKEQIQKLEAIIKKQDENMSKLQVETSACERRLSNV